MLNVLKKREYFHRVLNGLNKHPQKITAATQKPLLPSFKVAYRVAKC
jgi:hypothetical protein